MEQLKEADIINLLKDLAFQPLKLTIENQELPIGDSDSKYRIDLLLNISWGNSSSKFIAEILRQPRDPAKVIADAVNMRDDMARHKPASGPLDVKLGPGGLVDLEFAVHVLQLTRAQGLDSKLKAAVEELAKAGLLSASIVEAQKLLTRMLVVIRLLAPETASPNDDSRELMAHLCGASSWDDLLGRHDEARQSVAQLWDKVRKSA